jgi:hypothetical protein
MPTYALASLDHFVLVPKVFNSERPTIAADAFYRHRNILLFSTGFVLVYVHSPIL